MRPVPPLLLSLSLLAAGCRSPEDPVFIFGRAANADGSPLGGASLVLERGPLLSLFNAQRTPPPYAYAPYASATTEATGDFTLELLTADTQEWSSLDSLYYPLRVVVPLQDGQGVFITFSTQASPGDVELPQLRPWDARLRVDVGAEGPRLSFTAAPAPIETPPSARLGTRAIFGEGSTPGPGGLEKYELKTLVPEPLLRLDSGGAPLWLRRGEGLAWTPSAEVLEDFAAPQAQLRALSLGSWNFTPLASAFSYLDFRLEWRTAPVALPAGTRRPVSRGAACEPSPPGACPWTDGRLERVALTDAPGKPGPSRIEFTLEAPTRLRQAVIRGLAYNALPPGAKTLRMEGSAEGVSWVLLGEQRVEDGLAALPLEQMRGFYQEIEQPLLSVNPYGDPALDAFGEQPLFAELPLAETTAVRRVRLSLRLGEGDAARDVSLSALAEVSLFAAE